MTILFLLLNLLINLFLPEMMNLFQELEKPLLEVQPIKYKIIIYFS